MKERLVENAKGGIDEVHLWFIRIDRERNRACALNNPKERVSSHSGRRRGTMVNSNWGATSLTTQNQKRRTQKQKTKTKKGKEKKGWPEAGKRRVGGKERG